MDHKYFQSITRPFGKICKSKPMNQVTRYKQVQVSAKIMLEQKADVLNPIVIEKYLCTKTFTQYQRHHCTSFTTNFRP